MTRRPACRARRIGIAMDVLASFVGGWGTPSLSCRSLDSPGRRPRGHVRRSDRRHPAARRARLSHDRRRPGHVGDVPPTAAARRPRARAGRGEGPLRRRVRGPSRRAPRPGDRHGAATPRRVRRDGCRRRHRRGSGAGPVRHDQRAGVRPTHEPRGRRPGVGRPAPTAGSRRPRCQRFGGTIRLTPAPSSFRDPHVVTPFPLHPVRPPILADVDEPPAGHRDLVYATLGTVFDLESGDLFARIASALSTLDRPCVMTIGDTVSTDELPPVAPTSASKRSSPSATCCRRAPPSSAMAAPAP